MSQHYPQSYTPQSQAYGYQPGVGQAPVQYQQPNPLNYCPPGQQASSLPVAVQSPVPAMVPMGLQVAGQPYIPPSQMPRTGDGQVLQNEWYDFLLYGFGQTIRATEEIFSSPQRQGNEDLTNFSKPGELSNDTQFEICALWMYSYFNDPEGQVLPADSDAAPKLYDLLSTYTRFLIKQQKADKSVIPLHRIPSGGSVGGYDQNTASTVKHQGSSASFDLYRFDKKCRYLVPPGKTLKGVLSWMTNLPGGTVFPGGYNPLSRFNNNTIAEKIAEFGAVGIEVRDAVNG